MTDANRVRSAVGSRIGTIIVQAGWLALLAAAPARADVPESIRRALPATVGVEWHDGSEKKEAVTVPVPPAAAKDSYRYTATFKSLAETAKASRDRFGMASGTIVSADGLIVTTVGAHDSGTYSVTFNDGRSLPARLVVDDRRSGLQLLKVGEADLPFVTLSDQPPQIGEEISVTYCLDPKERAAARGIIAAKGRELKRMGNDLLQLDLSLGMMSGGGPVVDTQGRLVGIVAFRRASGSQPSSFAIPAAAVRALLDVRRGETTAVVQRGMLGIILARGREDGERVIAHPSDGSPAAAAGVREGDEILAVNGTKVDSLQELARLIGSHTAGQKVKLTIRREGKEQEIEATLAPAPEQTDAVAPPATGAVAAPKAAIEAVTPESIVVVDPDGGVRTLTGKAAAKSLEGLRDYYERAYRAQLEAAHAAPDGRAFPVPPVTAPSIRIQRTDLDKKLEEIGRDVQSLRQQMEKLTEELQRLQKQLSGGTAKP